jgi:putative membrane protein
MIKRIIVAIIVNGLVLYLLVNFLDEVSGTGEFKLYIIGGIIIGLLNAFLKPLMKILSLPFVLLTAGLFLIVINGVILYITEWIINTMQFQDVRLHFSGLAAYLLAGIILGLINWAQGILLKN